MPRWPGATAAPWLLRHRPESACSPTISFDESAFSQSLDNGNNWQQTSLMNTKIHMTDIAPAPDSGSLFMATYSEFGPESVWRSAGEPLGRYWGRLLNMPTDTNRVILRLSPNYATDYTLYAVEVDKHDIGKLAETVNTICCRYR